MQQQHTDPEALERLAHLEQHLNVPLSEEQRRQVLDRLSEGGGVWSREAIAAIPDCTEPAFIFRPFRLDNSQVTEQRHHE